MNGEAMVIQREPIAWKIIAIFNNIAQAFTFWEKVV